MASLIKNSFASIIPIKMDYRYFLFNQHLFIFVKCYNFSTHIYYNAINFHFNYFLKIILNYFIILLLQTDEVFDLTRYLERF
jgi:hypothetical protein